MAPVRRSKQTQVKNVEQKGNKDSDYVYSVAWANDLLRWFLRDILFSNAWVLHPYNKLIVALDVVDRLEVHGFWWQSERIRNQTRMWMKRSCTAEDRRGGDTLDRERREDSL